jgi:hypothetical protein
MREPEQRYVWTPYLSRMKALNSRSGSSAKSGTAASGSPGVSTVLAEPFARSRRRRLASSAFRSNRSSLCIGARLSQRRILVLEFFEHAANDPEIMTSRGKLRSGYSFPFHALNEHGRQLAKKRVRRADRSHRYLMISAIGTAAPLVVLDVPCMCIGERR